MNKSLLILAAFAGLAFTSNAQPFSGVTLFDDSVSLFDKDQPITTGSYEARWGTFEGGVFTPYFGSGAVAENDGYIGDPFGFFEASVTLSAPDNLTVSVGSAIYLAFTLLADNSDYASSENEVILTDPSWTVPVFVLVGNPIEFSFTQQTTALKGSFTYSQAGNDIIATAIPEPSAFAALAGVMALGMVASRRRRSA